VDRLAKRQEKAEAARSLSPASIAAPRHYRRSK
jgi:hypothetical protein